MDKTKKPLKGALKKATAAPTSTPLKSALKKTTTTTTTTSSPTPTTPAKTSKRKHTPNLSTVVTNSQGKRFKTETAGNHTKKSASGSKANEESKKSANHALQTKKNNNNSTTATTRVKPTTVANKPKKIPVIPEGATFEDFRIVAGTYENILYGVDAYWNEVKKHRSVFVLHAFACLAGIPLTDRAPPLFHLSRI